MAVLTASGVRFSATDNINSIYEIYQQGSIVVFYQANPPTGWTRSTAHNDKALRVVSGTGGGSGGAISFLTAFPAGGNRTYSSALSVSGSVGGTTIGNAGNGSHDHGNGFGNAGRHGWNPGGQGSNPVGGVGGNGAHAHPFSGSGTVSGSADFRVQYIDVIICSRN